MNLMDSMDLLHALALGDRLELSDSQQRALAWLLERNLVRKVEPPRKIALEQAYEQLQERHAQYVEAKACLERLTRRVAPKSRLGGLLPSASAPKLPGDDPEVMDLFNRLGGLEIKIRDLDHPRDVGARLEKIREHLSVEDRDCLSRMATIDRELHALQRQPNEGTQVDPIGFIALTEAGDAELPEACVLEELEAVFNAVSGPRRHKIEDYGHFREDPASLLIFMLDNPMELDVMSQRVVAYESLAEALDHLMGVVDLRTFRNKNAFLMRLLCSYRGQPRRPFLWCNRERLHALMERGRNLFGALVPATDSMLVHAWDLFGKELAEDDSRIPGDGAFPSAVAAVQTRTRERPLDDRALLRLAGALLQESQRRRRPFQQCLDIVGEARSLLPADLSDESLRWLGACHLAHLAGFEVAGLKGAGQRFQAVEAGFLGPSRERLAPVQVVLHALASQQRLEHAGLWVEPGKYAATYRRILRRVEGHREMGRCFQGDPVLERDLEYLAAYLTARTYFQDPDVARDPQSRADLGLAGCYEHPHHHRPPLLGAAFGTLMLA